MPHLFGDEPLRITELDQMGDIGVPQAVQGELGRQSRLHPCDGESPIHGLGRHAPSTLGQPELLTVPGAEEWAAVVDPLAQSVDHPVELRNGEHGATPGRAAAT